MKFNYLLRTVLLSCMGALLAQISFAQKTGSFDRTINFNGDSHRALSYYVPASYNPSKKYKLIIALHGLGNTHQAYRDFMAYLSQNSASPVYNAIIICPSDGADSTLGQSSDFWTPVSDTAIITRAIMDGTSAYNIDPGYIYLNGFSLGGRSALRYGLINYKRFRGLELWTPALQSMDEVNNLTSFTYPWQNGKYIPITISTGSNDGNAILLTTAYQHLSDAGAIVNFQIYYGMAHSQPSFQDVCTSFRYLDSNASSYGMNDAGVSNIASPFEEICGTSFTPIVTIQNKGINNITSAIINYQIDNGTVNTYSWSGNLPQLGRAAVTLSSQSVSPGTHTFKAYTSMPNGVADTVPTNDGISINFNSIMNRITSIAEGFESAVFPPTGWRLAGTDSAWNWRRTHNGQDPEFEMLTSKPSGAYGQSSSCIYFDNEYEIPNNLGKSYSIRTPQVDFTNASSPSLTYDYAYAPFRDSSGTFTATDTLVVYYSTDCGSTWHVLLRKGGLALSSTGGYAYAITFPFVPTSAQWKQETIDLNITGLVGQPEVMFSFENRCDLGHMLYLDNININSVTGIVSQTKESLSVNIYPNPNNGSFALSFSAKNEDNCTIEIRNLLGQVIYTEKLNGFSGDYTKQFDMREFGNAMYFVSLKTANNEVTKKVIVY